MRLLLVVISIFISSPLMAATLSKSGTTTCMARLDGTIEVGDFDAFRRSAERLLIPSNSEEGTGDVTICLNSAGGSLAEAARIADYVETKWIGTVVDDGDHCLSACSIIFMMGTRAYVEDFGINRKLHINGTLGFHKPSFSLPEGGTHSSATVNKAFDIAIEATLRFVQLANRMQNMNDTPMIKSDLIEMMFSHSGQDFFYIDTVDKVGRWEIEVFGYDTPKSASEREALTACDNLSNWQIRLSEVSTAVSSDELESLAQEVQIVKFSLDSPDPVYLVRGRVHGMGDRQCQIQFDFSERGAEWGEVQACGGDLWSAHPIGEQCSPLPGEAISPGRLTSFSALALFPSDTKLRDLPVFSARIEAEATQIEAQVEVQLDERGYERCGGTAGRQRSVMRVKNFVNIRRSPSFEADVVAQAPKHLMLTVVEDGGKLVGTPETRKRCQLECSKLKAYFQYEDKADFQKDRNAKRQCFLDNAIWYKVRLPDQTEGYVSAKYLR